MKNWERENWEREREKIIQKILYESQTESLDKFVTINIKYIYNKNNICKSQQMNK